MTYERMMAIDAAIDEARRRIEYDTTEMPIEDLVARYAASSAEPLDDDADLLVGGIRAVMDSQRIESMILGVPLPPIMVGRDGKVLRGADTIAVIAAFIADRLALDGLARIPMLNGLRFSDLLSARQRKFRRISVRVVIFSAGDPRFPEATP